METTRNQCDGCCAGAPADANGIHNMGTGGLQGCEAYKYAADSVRPQDRGSEGHTEHGGGL